MTHRLPGSALKEWPGRCPDQTHDIEIEDLIPPHVAERVSAALRDDAYDATLRCGSRMHYRYSQAWKDWALDRLPRELKGEDCKDLVWLGEEINTRISRIIDRNERQRRIDSPGGAA